MELLQNLDPLLRIFWYIAIPVSLFFIIQTIATFVGGGDAGDISTDVDGDVGFGDSLKDIFSLRAVVDFLLGFSWGGIAFFSLIPNKPLLIFVSVLIGIAFVVIFIFVIKRVMKLAEDDSFRIDETLNKTAEVYLTIPANGAGKGKVLISVRGSVRELEAMTNGAEPLGNKTAVKVVEIKNNEILIVEKI